MEIVLSDYSELVGAGVFTRRLGSAVDHSNIKNFSIKKTARTCLTARPGGLLYNDNQSLTYFLKLATPSVISLWAASTPFQPSTFTHLPFSSAL